MMIQKRVRTLGAAEAKVVLHLEEHGDGFIHTDGIARIVGIDRDRARKIAGRLLAKGWLERVSKGSYALVPAHYGWAKTGESNAVALACLIHQPCYVGWWMAASFHGFTTQLPSRLHVALSKQAPPRFLAGAEVKFVKLAPGKFFGHQEYGVLGRRAFISDPAKTVLDCIDRPDLSGGAAEVARITWGAATEVPEDSLVRYAERLGSAAVAARLGCLRDLVGRPLSTASRVGLHAMVPADLRTIIGAAEPETGSVGLVREWGVRINVSRETLFGDLPRGTGKAHKSA